MDAGDIQLCAGAALVREAISMRHSEREGDAFAREAVSRDRDYIRRVGARLGLNPAMVSGLIIMNDSLSARHRLDGVLSWLGQHRPSIV